MNGDELIGKTEIDLENRYYSSCYATCGLSKKYNRSGYNGWRDCLQPRQLLDKVCKKFGLQKPRYGEKSLEIYDQKGVLVYELPIFNPANDIYIESSSSSSSGLSSDDISVDEALLKTELPSEAKKLEQTALDALNNWEKITKV